MTNNFEIIYKELEKIDSSRNDDESLVVNEKEASPAEIDEIAELRRMVLEVSESDPYTYTSS